MADLLSPTDASAPPPPYSASEIQDDSLVEEIQTSLTLNSSAVIPRPSEVLAHLRLMRAFSDLELSIRNQDGLFGFYSEDLWSVSNSIELDRFIMDKELLPHLAAKRWQVYITRAVDRFAIWWTKIREKVPHRHALTNRQLKSLSMPAILEKEPSATATVAEIDLPPLDVLLVWYSYIINSWEYLEDCIRDGVSELWRLGIPWPLVNTCINSNFEYIVPPQTKDHFCAVTGLAWDNRDGPELTKRSCPNRQCKHSIVIPYTSIERADLLRWAKTSFRKKPHEPVSELPQGTGFADKSFKVECPHCRILVSDQYFRVAKFLEDFQHAGVGEFESSKAQPMRGTILDMDGRLRKYDKPWDYRMYPDALLRHPAMDSRKLLKATSITGYQGILGVVNEALSSKTVSWSITAPHVGVTSGNRPLADAYVNRMMSRYNTSSRFALDLVDAVLRQGAFVGKMRQLDWINAPNVKYMTPHALERYEQLFAIAAARPEKLYTLVPTLDIDLIWYTHQLSPARYYGYSVGKMHSAKYPSHVVSFTERGIKTTSEIYEDVYNEPYAQCPCWYCIDERLSRTLGTSLGMHVDPFSATTLSGPRITS